MSGKVGKDIAGAASLIADLFGGDIPGVRAATDRVREKMGISSPHDGDEDAPETPRNEAPNYRESTPPPATRPERARTKEDPKIVDLTPCPSCGSFFLDRCACGGAPIPAQPKIVYHVHDRGGRHVGTHTDSKRATEAALEIGGFVRPVKGPSA